MAWPGIKIGWDNYSSDPVDDARILTISSCIASNMLKIRLSGLGDSIDYRLLSVYPYTITIAIVDFQIADSCWYIVEKSNFRQISHIISPQKGASAPKYGRSWKSGLW